MIRKKSTEGVRDTLRSQISVHSDTYQPAQVNLSSSQKFFSFNQTFAGIEQNERILQEKTSSINRIRALQDELKAHKSKSILWEKTKVEILNLNKYLKLSSIQQGYSDSTLIKDFFQCINNILFTKDDKAKDDKFKLAENKKKESQLFEKLVESNKKKYELEQRIIHYEMQITKLTDINQSLREKSRAQSTERSSKIRQFPEETLITLHQKDSQLITLEERNNDLKLQLVRHQETIQALRRQLEQLQYIYATCCQEKEAILVQNIDLKEKVRILREEESKTEQTFLSIKQQLQKILEENREFEKQLQRRQEQLLFMKNLIENANSINDEYLHELQNQIRSQEIKRAQKIEKLLQRESELRQRLSNNIRLGGKRRMNKMLKVCETDNKKPLVECKQLQA